MKLSEKRGDTSRDSRRGASRPGYPAKLFVKKARSSCDDRAVHPRVPQVARPDRAAPRSRVALDDARSSKSVATASVDAVVTSPPYVATYDYLSHHALRLRWLDLDPAILERGEIGARRTYSPRSPPTPPCRRGPTRSRSFSSAAARTLRPGGKIVLLMADSAVARTPLRAHDIVADAAPRAGLEPLARASQERPHFHGPTFAAFRNAPRAEHALLLVRPATAG